MHIGWCTIIHWLLLNSFTTSINLLVILFQIVFQIVFYWPSFVVDTHTLSGVCWFINRSILLGLGLRSFPRSVPVFIDLVCFCWVCFGFLCTFDFHLSTDIFGSSGLSWFIFPIFISELVQFFFYFFQHNWQKWHVYIHAETNIPSPSCAKYLNHLNLASLDSSHTAICIVFNINSI